MNAAKPFRWSAPGDTWRDFKAKVGWTLSRLSYSPTYSIEFQVAQQRILSVFWVLLFAGLLALVGLTFLRYQAQWVWLAWGIYILGVVCILWKPVSGLYLILFFSLIGDSVLMPAYPFNKNFSSAESIFYVNDRLVISAVEVYIVVTVLSWLLRGIARKRLDFHWGPLGGMVLFFLVWVALGLLYGLSRGGDLTIALWEVRPLFYLPAMYFLAVNIIEDRRQINTLIWVVMITIFVQGLIGIWAFYTEYGGSINTTQSIMEHSASIHINSMIILILAVWLYRGSIVKRILLPLMAVPVLISYLANQRRASYVALGIALLLLLVALYRENRKAFTIIAPLALVISVTYLAAFWNNTSVLGMPARGVRTALMTSAGTRDYNSNLYRLIENVNTTFTIRNNLAFGVGFGNKFMIMVPMPDISFFEWWEYITHNSILWVWIQTGLLGFVAMLLLIGASVMVGVDVYDQLPRGDYKAIGLTLVLYLVMHFIYAYVDMSWDIQSMLYVGTAIGVLAALMPVMAKPEPESMHPSRRFARLIK